MTFTYIGNKMIRLTFFIFFVFITLLILPACISAVNTVSNEMEGIELELSITDSSNHGEIVANVILTNHNDSQRIVYVPVPKEIEESIAGVVIERKNKMLFKLLSPLDRQAISNIEGRSFYDFVRVQLDAGESIKQAFQWDKTLVNQVNNETVKARSGTYVLSAFIILDELKSQEDYYEPEKQLISKLSFKVKW